MEQNVMEVLKEMGVPADMVPTVLARIVMEAMELSQQNNTTLPQGKVKHNSNHKSDS